jgi:uncharacterized protein (DUF1330 family)
MNRPGEPTDLRTWSASPLPEDRAGAFRPVRLLIRESAQEEIMPKGYAIFTETIRDQARYDGYVQKAVPTILQSGGRPIVVYDDPEVIEGKWHGRRTVILEFDSMDAARNWYRSPAYQSIVS